MKLVWRIATSPGDGQFDELVKRKTSSGRSASVWRAI